MTKEDQPAALAPVLGPPTIVVISALLLSWMSSEVVIALSIWTLASFPIGVLFGHCVLSEE